MTDIIEGLEEIQQMIAAHLYQYDKKRHGKQIDVLQAAISELKARGDKQSLPTDLTYDLNSPYGSECMMDLEMTLDEHPRDEIAKVGRYRRLPDAFAYYDNGWTLTYSEGEAVDRLPSLPKPEGTG